MLLRIVSLHFTTFNLFSGLKRKSLINSLIIVNACPSLCLMHLLDLAVIIHILCVDSVPLNHSLQRVVE